MTQITDILGTSSQSKYQEFTSSGTWLKPNTVSHVEILLIGGGGGGGAAAGITPGGDGTEGYLTGGGGGGGGVIIERVIAVSSDINITIGAGGSGGGAAGNTPLSGSAGGDSSFGSLIALGGGAGLAATGYLNWDLSMRGTAGGEGEADIITGSLYYPTSGQRGDGSVFKYGKYQFGGGGGAGMVFFDNHDDYGSREYNAVAMNGGGAGAVIIQTGSITPQTTAGNVATGYGGGGGAGAGANLDVVAQGGSGMQGYCLVKWWP